MPSHNQVILAGHLGQDPELRYTPNQKPVASLSVATTEKKGDQDYTEWSRVVLWGKCAESFCRRYKKGDAVHILDGKLKTRKWTDKQGIERYTTEIHCFYVSGRMKEQSNSNFDPSDFTGPITNSSLDDIPF